jgi:hypothetical protein
MLKSLYGDNTKRIAPILFAYLFNAIGKYEYRDLIGDKELAKDAWTKAESSGYILKNCKLFMYASHVNKQHGVPTSPAKFGIHQEDVTLLRSVDLSHLKLKKLKKPMSLFDYDNLEGAVLTSTELKNYIGKFISKKLIFLRSYGLAREEIHSHLLHASIFAMRKHYPAFESDLHALNICKTSIHNSGMCLIEYWTRAKRQALLKENGTFQSVHVPFDSLHNVGVAPEHEDEFRLNIQSLVALTPTMSVKQQSFLSAAAGIYDPGFSMYLGHDNSDLVDSWGYDRYLSQLRSYFCVSEEQTKKLLGNLRTKIG